MTTIDQVSASNQPTTQGAAFTGYVPTWCPGCGNFGIINAIKMAFKKLGFSPEDVSIVFGIGCSGNMNDFLWANSFHALHGRALPTAIGVKIAHHDLPVLVIAGDGDCYGEGGNHFIHTCRGNHDLTLIVHDNRVYGLTTGQVAPTAKTGFKSKSTPTGIFEMELNPLALAITQGATFVSQGFSGDMIHLVDLICKAVSHKGFSLVNVFQPCVTFNHIQTYQWYRERIYKLDSVNHNATDISKAVEKSMQLTDQIPLGILYETSRLCYTEGLAQLSSGPLSKITLERSIDPFLKEFI